MPTSGIYVTTLTFTQLLTDALVDLGVLDVDESPSANQTTIGMRKFNNLLFQLKGPKTHFLPSEKGWTREVVSATPSASKAAYSIKPSGGDITAQIPTEIIAVILRKTSDSTDMLLKEITQAEYLAIPKKVAVGTPTKWFYEKRLDQGTLYVDCYSSATVVAGYTFQITYRQPLEVVTSGGQTMDIPDVWNRAFEWCLAKELGPSFTVDDKTWSRVVGMASESLGIANTHEIENPVAFYQPGKDIDD